MVYLLGEIAILLALAVLLGLIVGWLLWRWRQHITKDEYAAVIAERDERDQTIANLNLRNGRLEEDIYAIRTQSNRAASDRDGMEDRLTGVLIENSRLAEERDDLLRQVSYYRTLTAGKKGSQAATSEQTSAKQPQPVVQESVQAKPTPDIEVPPAPPIVQEPVIAKQSPDINTSPESAIPDKDVFLNNDVSDEPAIDLTKPAEEPSLVEKPEASEPVAAGQPIDQEPIDLTQADQPDHIDLTDTPDTDAGNADTGSTIVRTVDGPVDKATAPVVETSKAAAVAGATAGTATGAAVAAGVPEAKTGFFSKLFSKRTETTSQVEAAPESGDVDLFSQGSEQNSDISSDSVSTPETPAAQTDQVQANQVQAEQVTTPEAATTTPPQQAQPNQGQADRDDLTRINEITPALEIFLHNQDIWTYRQLGSLGDSDIDALQEQLPDHPGIVREQDWIEQARRLYNEKFS